MLAAIWIVPLCMCDEGDTESPSTQPRSISRTVQIRFTVSPICRFIALFAELILNVLAVVIIYKTYIMSSVS